MPHRYIVQETRSIMHRTHTCFRSLYLQHSVAAVQNTGATNPSQRRVSSCWRESCVRLYWQSTEHAEQHDDQRSLYSHTNNITHRSHKRAVQACTDRVLSTLSNTTTSVHYTLTLTTSHTGHTRELCRPVLAEYWARWATRRPAFTVLSH